MTVIAVLADCHIHPPKIDWPAAALAALKGVDRIVTLGDMGEAAGFAALRAIAQVDGVLGEDDDRAGEITAMTMVIEEGGLRIGCVFDPVAAGLASGKAPFTAASDMAEVEDDLFDGPVDVLLCASTHKAGVWPAGRVLVVDPGSPTLPDGGKGAFARLTIEDGKVSAEIVEL